MKHQRTKHHVELPVLEGQRFGRAGNEPRCNATARRLAPGDCEHLLRCVEPAHSVVRRGNSGGDRPAPVPTELRARHVACTFMTVPDWWLTSNLALTASEADAVSGQIDEGSEPGAEPSGDAFATLDMERQSFAG
jgi:hypothetical protein